MSTVLLGQEIPDWLSETSFETLADPIGELIIVLSGQFEQTDLPYNGWFDCACVDCERVETFQGCLSEFAEHLHRLGWCADSLDRSTAICKTCANAPDTNHYAAQYDGSGGLL